MNISSILFKKEAKELLDSSSKILDSMYLAPQQREEAKVSLENAILSTLVSLENAHLDAVRQEEKRNWLQKSWRPIVMLTFAAVLLLGAFVEVDYLENQSPFWTLLQMGLGGYVIGRSAEKGVINLLNNSYVAISKKKTKKDT